MQEDWLEIILKLCGIMLFKYFQIYKMQNKSVNLIFILYCFTFVDL